MEIPEYWLPRPLPDPDPEVRASFDAIWQRAVDRGDRGFITDPLPGPKWQFLCHLADQHGLAMHGSGNADIHVFEPRQANDTGEFGNQKAVYAAGDGIWAMYFAIVDRTRVTSLTNACVRLVAPDGTVSGPWYVFAVNASALPSRPWRPGTVYVLPNASFVEEAPERFGESEVRVPHLASFVEVRPLAKVAVEPADFPFLDQVLGTDESRFVEYGEALRTGAPWPG